MVLSEEPLCRTCAKEGKTVVAVYLDHIKPINQGGDKLDRTNLQPLCASCHAVKSGKEAHG